MSKTGNVLVIATWDNCGNCTTFKNKGHLDKIRAHFKDNKKLTIYKS